MKDRTKAAIFGAGAVLSAAVIGDTVSRVIDRSLVGEALDREEPKTMARVKSRLTGSETEEALEALTARGREKLEGMPHRIVELTSFDGTRLVGHLFPVKEPKRAVVAMHGWRSTWARDFCLVADFLRDSGCTVLYAEQRGQGDSEGEYMGFGMIERHDCLEWVRWMNANGFGDLPLYLAGISMGATTVLMAAGSPELPENVRGIVADCGFTSARAIWQHISENNLHIPYRRHQKRVDDLCRKRIDLDSDAYSTLDAMQTNATPVLFVHGTADTFVPADMTRENYEACSAPKKLLLVEGANHGLSYVTDRQAYESAVRSFWAEQEK